MRLARFVSVLFLFGMLSGSCFVNAQNQSDLNELKDKSFHTQHKPNNVNSLNIKRVGAWPYGPALAVAVDEPRDLIFLGSGGAVLVLDGIDRTNPILITDSIRTAGLVMDLCYDSTTQRLYIAAGEGGMEIWDVQNPALPVQLSNFEVLYFGYETPVENIGVYGNYAVVSCNWGYVHSVDVSDPTNPVQVSANGTMGNPARDLFVSPDGQAHTSGAQYYVRLQIQAGGTLNTSAAKQFDYGPYAVYGNESYAYIGYAGYLFIQPLPNAGGLPLSTTNMNGISDIVVKNNWAYILNSSGVQIWNVLDPYNPEYIGAFQKSLYSSKFAVAEGYAYIANHNEGLSIVEIGDGTSPVEVGTYDVWDYNGDAVIKGDYAYLAHGEDGMLVIDVSELGNFPVLVGQYDTPDITADIQISGNHAFLADLMGGLRIADITDPLNPVEVGVLNSANVSKVAVSGNYAYILTYVDPNDPYSLEVVDISNLSNPVLKGSIVMPDRVADLDVTGNYVYVAARDDGIRVIDVSNPDSPSEVFVLPMQSVLDVFILDDYTYFASADWDGGFGILDITDPANPVLKSLYNPYGWFHPFDVYVVDDYAWVGDPVGSQTLHLFDISDRSNPIELDEFVLPGSVVEIFGVDSLVYVSDGASGLQILENLLYSTPGGGVTWQQQNSGTTNTLSSVYFADQNTGWIAGESGTIMKTENGGSVWSNQSSGTSSDLSSVYFVNTLTGWSVGDGGTILKTTNGGDNWVNQTSGTTALLTSVHFIDESTGWTVGNNGVILKTTNGGTSWQQQNSGTPYGLFSVDFVDANYGWCAGSGYGMVLRTTDGGSNWLSINTGSSDVLFAVDFVNDNVGWAVGMFGAIQKSTDTGITWQDQNGVFPPDWLYSVCFIDENTGWTVGFDGKVQTTTDGGENWNLQTSVTPYQLNSVYFIDETHGWAVGENGTIIKTNTGATGIEENHNELPVVDEFVLYNNYPNPFNPSTTIRFNLPDASQTRLVVHNILGQEVKELVNGFLSEGMYEVEWDGTNNSGRKISSGIYFYTIQAGDVRIAKKMILSK